MTIYAERAYDRALLRDPAYTAGAPGADGWSYDAGTLMLAQSEAAHLVHESCRHLGATVGPGFNAGSFSSRQAVWQGIDGLEAPQSWDGSDYAQVYQRIPWDRRTAIRFPCTHAIEDRADSDRDARLRTIALRAHFVIGASATEATAYFALSFGSNPRSIGPDSPIASAVLALSGVTVASATLTLTTPAPYPSTRLRARADSALGAQALCAPFWLWVGWRIITPTPGGDHLLSASAWERR